MMNATNTGKLYFYNNQGVAFGQTKNQLKTFSEGSNLEVTMLGDVMKIGMKKNSAEYKVGGGEFYFFFSLVGDVQVDLSYFPAK